MYSPRKLVFVTIILTMIFIFCFSDSFAATLPSDEPEYESFAGCFIAEFPDNTYDGSKPIVFFFPGSGEANSINATVRFIKDYAIYDDIDASIVAVAINNNSTKTDYSDWDNLGKQMSDWLYDKYLALDDDMTFEVIVDCVSMGGLGGTYFTEYALEAGVDVSQINLADACTGWCTKEILEGFMEQGVDVNVYACNGPKNISERSRGMIKALDGNENFHGVVLDCSHGQCLHDAVYEDGLHTDY